MLYIHYKNDLKTFENYIQMYDLFGIYVLRAQPSISQKWWSVLALLYGWGKLGYPEELSGVPEMLVYLMQDLELTEYLTLQFQINGFAGMF